MIRVEYSSHFIRKYKKLDPQFKREVKVRIEEFRDEAHHKKLEVHKLKGDKAGYWAFSVNYSDRVAFEFSKDMKTAYLYDVDDHTIYD